MGSPAFKEWRVIVEALGSGEQVLIFRKGGIAEGRGGFQLKEKRFWLFPTEFHAQREKTKPGAQTWFANTSERASNIPPAAGGAEAVELKYFAEVADHRFVDEWQTILRLDAFHFWTEETLRDRFDWGKPPGLHAFIVRVHRLATPLVLGLTPEMAGCKSWVDLPFEFDGQASTPVLSEATFAQRLAEITDAVNRQV